MSTATTHSSAGKPGRRTVLRAIAGGAVIGATMRGATASAAHPPFVDAAALPVWRSRPFEQIPIPTAAFRGHAAFPSLVGGPARSLTIAYRNGTDHVYALDGTIVLATSLDSGTSWQNYRTVQQNPTAWGTPAGDLRDPSVSRIGAGELWLTWCVGPSSAAGGVFVQRPGHAPVRMDPGLSAASMCAPVVELPDGSVATVFYGTLAGETRASAWFTRSTDLGATWSSRKIVDGQALGNDFPEPWLMVRGSTLVVLHRHGTWANIGVTTSTDLGVTWTPTRVVLTQATGRPGAYAASTGQLLMIYRHPATRSAMLAVSGDDGQTWGQISTLFASEGGPLGMTYAAMAETVPGRVRLVVASERPDGSSVLHTSTLVPHYRC